MNNSNKFEKRKVKFFDGLEIDGYMMPGGSFRVDLSGTSKMLGYGQQWLSQGISRDGTLLKALQGLGFSGQVETSETLRGKNAQTISLRDFQRILIYAVQKGKPQAIAMQMALTDPESHWERHYKDTVASSAGITRNSKTKTRPKRTELLLVRKAQGEAPKVNLSGQLGLF